MIIAVYERYDVVARIHAATASHPRLIADHRHTNNRLRDRDKGSCFRATSENLILIFVFDLVTNSPSEKQVELIQERLAHIEQVLCSRASTLSDSQLHNESKNGNAAKAGPQVAASSPVASSEVETPLTFEGDSSFSNQTERASQVEELTVANQSSEMKSAVDSLRKSIAGLSAIGARTGYHFNTSEPRNCPVMPLLPMEVVLKILRHIKDIPAMFILVYIVRPVSYFEDLCRKVYFPTEPVSLGSLTLLNGIMFFILMEYKTMEHPVISQLDLDAYMELCEANLHKGLETYDLLVEPSLDNVRALLLGSTKALCDAKSSLCWALICCAARHCQSLGYHRETTMSSDTWEDAEDKRFLLWTIYALEKNMSFTLGRSSCFNDHDIDTLYYTPSKDPHIGVFDKAAILMLDFARLQGNIYDDLFCVHALNKPQQARMQTIANLSSRLEAWWQTWKLLSDPLMADLFDNASLKKGPCHIKPGLSEYYALAFGPSEVLYYSVLTTLHKASTAGNSARGISSACFDAAKRSLESHLHFFPYFKAGSNEMLMTYVAW